MLRRVIALALQLLELFRQWRLVLLERLDLTSQCRSLAGFVDSGADGGGERGPDNGFLECGHGDGLGDGCGGRGGGRCSRKNRSGNRRSQSGRSSLDGVSGKSNAQSGGARRDATVCQQRVQFLQRPVHSHPRGIFRGSQRFAHRAEIALLEVAQQNRGAVPASELGNGFIEDGGNLSQAGAGVVPQRVHFHGLAFPGLTAPLAAHGPGGNMIRALMQPPAQHHPSGKRAALARQGDKDRLRHVLGQLCIPADQAERHRIDEVDVARDQFAKGRFGTGPGVFGE